MPTSWGVLSRGGPARYPPDRCGLLLVSKSPGGALFMGLGCLGLLLPLRAAGGAGGAPPATGTLFLCCISHHLWQNTSTFVSSKNPVTEVTESSCLDMCTEPEQLPAQGTATGKAWWLQGRAPGRRGHDLGQVWPVERPGLPASLPVAWLSIPSPDIPVGPTCGCPSRLGGTPVGRGHCGD